MRRKRAKLRWVGIAALAALLLVFLPRPAYQKQATFARTGTEWVEVLPNHESAPFPGLQKPDRLVTREGNVVFDVKYTTDALRRRVTPDKHSLEKKQHALFLGCAYTFGIGANDDQTIPYYFGSGGPYKAYNLAFIGYGPNDLLARMNEAEDFWRDIPEKDGVAYYLYIPDHLNRMSGTVSWLYRAGGQRPYFHETDGGRLVQDGTFESARPYTTKFLKLLTHLQLGKPFEFAWGVVPRPERLSLLVQMVKEMRRLYLSRFPRGSFKFVALPQWDPNSAELHELLNREGIPWIDLDSLMRQARGLPTFGPADGHFPPAANQLIARQLIDAQEKSRSSFSPANR